MQENKKEKKDTSIMLIAVVALIVMMIVGGYYWYIYAPQQLNNPKKTEQQKELELQLLREKINNDTEAKMFFEAIDKRKNFNLDYYGSYQEIFADMKTQKVVVQRIGEKRYVSMQNYVYGQEIYYDENEMQFCQTEYADSQVCAKVESEQKKEIEKGLNEIFLSYKDTERETNEKMYKYGILKFEKTPTRTQIASRNCNMMEYQLNYSNLSDDALLELGLNRTDPVV
jgi:cytochrome c-type biogenesis protein CcmE